MMFMICIKLIMPVMLHAREWLRDHGYDPDAIFYSEDSDPKERQAYNDTAMICMLEVMDGKPWRIEQGE